MGGRRNAKCVPLPAVKMPLECHFMRTELVTTLKRKATEIIADLEQDHQPVLITQHGRPAAYLVDVESFEALNQRIAVLEGIARAEQAIEQGRVVSHAEAKNRMGRWLN
jgi:prevent-host-death family protein